MELRKNGEVTPSDIAIGSQKKVWWKCEKGHEWQTTPRIEIMGKVARIVQEDYL